MRGKEILPFLIKTFLFKLSFQIQSIYKSTLLRSEPDPWIRPRIFFIQIIGMIT